MFNTNKLKRKINELEFENLNLKIELEKYNDFIKKFIVFFNNIMGGHDSSFVTSKHITRVSNMVEDFFKFVKRDYIENNTNVQYDIFVRSVILGAYLHDLGKFHIPDSIISKPGKLTDLEYDIVKEHPKFGSLDLIELPIDDKMYNKSVINNIVLHHHSNLDGSGYPNGLIGDEIPFEARIVAVCDRLETIMAKRSYKESKTLIESINILKEDTGKIDLNILKIIEDNINYFKKYEE